MRPVVKMYGKKQEAFPIFEGFRLTSRKKYDILRL